MAVLLDDVEFVDNSRGTERHSCYFHAAVDPRPLLYLHSKSCCESQKASR